MVCATNGDEEMELGSDRAFKCGEHGVCVFVVHGDDVEGVIVGGVAFFWWSDV